MRRSLLIQLVIFIILLGTLGCSSKANNTLLPTDEQISDFIEQEEIQVIQKKNIFNELTVILYQKLNETGFFMLYQDKKGELYNKKVSGVVIPDEPVYLSGSATNLPFVTVVLDKMIIDKHPAKVEVMFADGTIVEEDIVNKRGVIIPYIKKIEGNLSYSNLKIYNVNGEVIFEK